MEGTHFRAVSNADSWINGGFFVFGNEIFRDWTSCSCSSQALKPSRRTRTIC